MQVGIQGKDLVCGWVRSLAVLILDKWRNFMKPKMLKNKFNKKTPVLMSPFGFALAACGGGGNSSQPISDSSNDTNGNANPPESDMSSSLTPLEQLTYNLANSQGPQTQFTPEANTPNEKDVLGLDPANYFDNSNKVHFYGYTDMTVQPARDYHGEYTPERVVSYGPNENIFLIDSDNADQYFFAAETAGYASTLDGKRVPKLFKYDGLSFQDLVPLQLPELSRMQVGADNFFLNKRMII